MRVIRFHQVVRIQHTLVDSKVHVCQSIHHEQCDVVDVIDGRIQLDQFIQKRPEIVLEIVHPIGDILSEEVRITCEVEVDGLSGIVTEKIGQQHIYATGIGLENDDVATLHSGDEVIGQFHETTEIDTSVGFGTAHDLDDVHQTDRIEYRRSFEVCIYVPSDVELFVRLVIRDVVVGIFHDVEDEGLECQRHIEYEIVGSDESVEDTHVDRIQDRFRDIVLHHGEIVDDIGDDVIETDGEDHVAGPLALLQHGLGNSKVGLQLPFVGVQDIEDLIELILVEIVLLIEFGDKGLDLHEQILVLEPHVLVDIENVLLQDRESPLEEPLVELQPSLIGLIHGPVCILYGIGDVYMSCPVGVCEHSALDHCTEIDVGEPLLRIGERSVLDQGILYEFVDFAQIDTIDDGKDVDDTIVGDLHQHIGELSVAINGTVDVVHLILRTRRDRHELREFEVLHDGGPRIPGGELPDHQFIEEHSGIGIEIGAMGLHRIGRDVLRVDVDDLQQSTVDVTYGHGYVLEDELHGIDRIAEIDHDDIGIRVQFVDGTQGLIVVHDESEDGIRERVCDGIQGIHQLTGQAGTHTSLGQRIGDDGAYTLVDIIDYACVSGTDVESEIDIDLFLTPCSESELGSDDTGDEGSKVVRTKVVCDQVRLGDHVHVVLGRGRVVAVNVHMTVFPHDTVHRFDTLTERGSAEDVGVDVTGEVLVQKVTELRSTESAHCELYEVHIVRLAEFVLDHSGVCIGDLLQESGVVVPVVRIVTFHTKSVGQGVP